MGSQVISSLSQIYLSQQTILEISKISQNSYPLCGTIKQGHCSYQTDSRNSSLIIRIRHHSLITVVANYWPILKLHHWHIQ